ncbi:FAD-dependent monooxygenase [Acidocella sp.]|uniref:FAD-dependent monooxygenase n=1 Tax=Acidocella sp. TaxID=50710 RepID=UPI002613A035|nr:FAD-dependent monooxygenase [Acidocella sp.]
MATKVLIVGAGPVGLTLAAELHRFGLEVRLIDKQPAPTTQSRALFLWSRTLEQLDRLHLSGEMVALGRKIRAVNVMAGHSRIGHIGFAGTDTPYPFALLLPQAQTERLLIDHLAAQGVFIERATELAGFEDGPTGVTATLKRDSGESFQLTTDWLVGADGAASFVRRALGLSSTGAALQSDWLIADGTLEGAAFPEDELLSFWHEDGFLGLFPLGQGQYRVIAEVPRGAGTQPITPDLAGMQSRLEARGPGGLRLINPRWFSSFRIHERNMADYRQGHVFLVGDAAHVFNPVGAQGLNMGIQDAVNLAWKLALVAAGTVNAEALLESYTAERHVAAAQVVAETGRAEAVALLRSPTLRLARNLLGGLFFGLSPLRKSVAESLAKLSTGYDQSPLNGPCAAPMPGPQPGDRMPPHPNAAPIGAHGPRFALFADPSRAVMAVQQEFAAMLEPALRPPPQPGGVWLVRPDGYVAACGADGELNRLADYLRRFQPLNQLAG